MGALQHLQEGCQGRVNFLTVLHGETTRGSRHKTRGFNWGKKKKQNKKQNKTKKQPTKQKKQQARQPENDT